MPFRRPRFVLADLVLIIAFVGLFAGFVRWMVRFDGNGSLGTLLLFILAMIGWSPLWGIHRNKIDAKPCEQCGRPWSGAGQKKGARHLCAHCQSRSRAPAQVRSQGREQLRVLIVAVLLLSVLVAFLSSVALSRHLSGLAYWIALAAGSVALVLGFFVVVFVVIFVPIFLIILLRNRRMEDETHCFAFAERCAGREGQIHRLEPLTIWASGPSDPVPMLQEQERIARERLSAILARKMSLERPLRMLAFDRRASLVDFHRQAATNFWLLDGYFGSTRRQRTATLHCEDLPQRYVDPQKTARSLFVYALAEDLHGVSPSQWVQQGLAWLAGVPEGPAVREMLNRWMLAALERDGVLSANTLFTFSPKRLFNLLKNWYDLDAYTGFTQFLAQSWSFAEFLTGADAPPDRRERFRRFLLDPPDRPRSIPSSFERHFGFSPGELDDQWRAWVRAQGVGEFRPPSEPARDILTRKLIPLAEDESALIMDRIQAVREIGRSGELLGASALIGLLRADPTLPREELVRALQNIAGATIGDDPARWKAWRATLPADSVLEAVSPP